MKPLDLKIPGFSIAGQCFGHPDKPPILALHGWLDNANSFDWLASHLEKDYYLIAIDLPGHGLSSHLCLGGHYHFTDGIFTINDIINVLGFNQIHLLGHSMGACLASLVAGVIPNRILSLALIEGLGPFSEPGDSARLQISNYLAHQISPDKKSGKGYKNMEEAALARSKRGHVSVEIASKLCERGVKNEDEVYNWRHDPRLLVPSPLRMTEEQVLSCLKGIQAKTHLLLASDGFSFDSDLMQKRMQAVKHIESHQLQGGHHIHMEQSEKVADLLLQFYQSL